MEAYNTIEEVLALPWKKNPSRGNRGGVYRVVERETGNLLYIGQTSNLRHRLTPSQHPIYDRNIHDLYVLFIDNRDERGWMEYNFIGLLKPQNNIRQGQLHSHTSEDVLSAYYAKVFEGK